VIVEWPNPAAAGVCYATTTQFLTALRDAEGFAGKNSQAAVMATLKAAFLFRLVSLDCSLDCLIGAFGGFDHYPTTRGLIIISYH